MNIYDDQYKINKITVLCQDIIYMIDNLTDIIIPKIPIADAGIKV